MGQCRGGLEEKVEKKAPRIKPFEMPILGGRS